MRFLHDNRNSNLAHELARALSIKPETWQHNYFPDGESHIVVPADLNGKETTVLVNLAQPDSKIFPLMLALQAMRDAGASKITLVAPYLPYMRQDRIFQPGETISAKIFSRLLSQFIDKLITIDPHLHRIQKLEDVYSVECRTLSASAILGTYVRNHFPNFILIGPDEESRQWITQAANGAPFEVFQKRRHSGVEVSTVADHLPDLTGRTAIILDDIISSGATLIEAARILKNKNVKEIHAIAVHGFFSSEREQKIKQAGYQSIFVTNSIPHPASKISVAELLASAIRQP